MECSIWNPDLDARGQLRELCDRAVNLGVLIVEFAESRMGEPLSWSDLDPWTRSRAVTAADLRGPLAPPALDVALCCDLVYLRSGAQLLLPGPDEPPTGGTVWAMVRAGHAAVARGLLAGGTVAAEEAVRLGMAQAVLPDDSPIPLPEPCSLAALTTARDLMRSRASRGPGLALELASFRLLFASGDPAEGARAFLERRTPDFGRDQSSRGSPTE